jgi:uncharacterized DUF497 family protein
MEFVCDPEKNRSNTRKHGFSLRDAQAVFLDPHRVDDIDDREYGEKRWVPIGMVGPIIAYVVYTERGDTIRLISARKALPDEEFRYDKRRFRLV